MTFKRTIALAALALSLTVSAAQAKHSFEGQITCNQQGCSDRASTEATQASISTTRHHRAFKGQRRYAAPSARAGIGFNDAGSGIVRSGKTGATAHVSPSHSAAFQAYINELEAGGATIRFMGGYRKGHCWSGGMHPCGLALDVCQLRRGSVDRRCNLPGRTAIAAIAARHGLFEGGQWCSSDYGHAQYGISAGPCGHNLYAAVGEFQVRKHHRHRRYASR